MGYEEIWKWVDGYEHLYAVSSLGNVAKATMGLEPERLLNMVDNGNGYLRVGLYLNGVSKHYYVHRLVAQAFIPNDQNKPQVNHIDGNRQNNVVENLEWVTRSENNKHAFYVLGAKKVNRKLSDEQVRLIRGDQREHKIIAAEYGISRAYVSAIKTGAYRKAAGGELECRGHSQQRILTASQVAYILESDETNAALANELGVSASTISGIRTGRIYRDIRGVNREH